jgi:hypothetical protein
MTYPRRLRARLGQASGQRSDQLAVAGGAEHLESSQPTPA